MNDWTFLLFVGTICALVAFINSYITLWLAGFFIEKTKAKIAAYSFTLGASLAAVGRASTASEQAIALFGLGIGFFIIFRVWFLEKTAHG